MPADIATIAFTRMGCGTSGTARLFALGKDRDEGNLCSLSFSCRFRGFRAVSASTSRSRYRPVRESLPVQELELNVFALLDASLVRYDDVDVVVAGVQGADVDQVNTAFARARGLVRKWSRI